ncbi:nucleotide-binding universal stress UspA family protein [Methanomicrobium sp. W14]|jgi:nucleotide-binding universal stress UspA family protein|uniref:universal stress protein n=1 Tax=Methanomicrobium sp. W14 TaxID=2817839 RepID=UPI001AEB2DCC|nr:universal stress protein [Methanomicrobium sp. W14]MBP2132328.1 nucleotide-binding universal stress UspA family protein [Methanomicrobium sp. W14]
MFKTILVAVDGSKASEKAIEAAIDESKIRKSAVNAVYVIETGLFRDIPTDSTMELLYTKFETIGKEAFSQGEDVAKKSNVEIKTYIRKGHAGDEILKLADEINADLIVVGSTGKSNVDRMFLGSVSEYVIRNSKVSTMVVRV